MKTKFWRLYLPIVFLFLGVVYWSTAEMSDVPLALSDTQMEQLSGSLIDWDCIAIPPCGGVPCNNNNHVEVVPMWWCTTCETDPSNTCYYEVTYCTVCQVRIYYEDCSGQYDSYYESWRECE